jgi:hypothetical protein
MHLNRLPLITLWIELSGDYIFELIKVSFMKYITSSFKHLGERLMVSLIQLK